MANGLVEGSHYEKFVLDKLWPSSDVAHLFRTAGATPLPAIADAIHRSFAHSAEINFNGIRFAALLDSNWRPIRIFVNWPCHENFNQRSALPIMFCLWCSQSLVRRLKTVLRVVICGLPILDSTVPVVLKRP
jgi:hypothetical protein